VPLCCNCERVFKILSQFLKIWLGLKIIKHRNNLGAVGTGESKIILPRAEWRQKYFLMNLLQV
jgi:hypothetical protein